VVKFYWLIPLGGATVDGVHGRTSVKKVNGIRKVEAYWMIFTDSGLCFEFECFATKVWWTGMSSVLSKLLQFTDALF